MDIRPGEGAAAALLFLYFFLVIAFQYTTKSVRQSEFISALGAGMLPLVYLSVALASYPCLLLYSRFVDRVRRERLIAGTSLVVAASMVLFWWLLRAPTEWVPFVFYLWISIVYVLNVSQFWSYANHVFDPRQAKRLFGLIGAGGLLGSVAGGQLAVLATGLVGTRFALLLAAAWLLVVAGFVGLVERLRPAAPAHVGRAGRLTKLAQARGGFATILQSRHLQLIAAIMLLMATVAQVVDLQFNWAVAEVVPTKDARTQFFGNFYAVMGVAAFVFQLLVTSRIHRWLGIGFAMRVLPTAMAVGTISLFIAAGFFPAALLMAAILMKVGENGVRYSLDQTTRELLFLPVPSVARLKAKATIDVFVQRFGKGVGALLLLPVTFAVLTPVQAGWITLSLVGIWLVVTVAMRNEYVRSYREGLRKRAVDADVPVDLKDVTSLEILVQALGSADSGQVLYALELLDDNGKGHLVSPLLLYHDSPEVRRRTLAVLAAQGREDAAPLVERLLADPDNDVRAEAVRALASLLGDDAGRMMRPRLQDADPRVRAAAVACLLAHGGDDADAEARAVVTEMVMDADPAVRSEAAAALAGASEPGMQQELVQLLYDDDRQVARRAIAAVRARASRAGPRAIYVPILASLMHNRRLKHEAREALVAFGQQAIAPLLHFLDDEEEEIWVRRAIPKTIALIGGDKAVRALVSCLDGHDTLLRRKIIEALVSLGRAGEDLSFASEAITAQIRRQCRAYLQDASDLMALDSSPAASFDGAFFRWPGGPPSLLHQLLADRLRHHVWDVFGLLALLYPGRDMRAVRHSLDAGSPALRTYALEYLDNALAGGERRLVLAMVGDEPLDVRLRDTGAGLGVVRSGRDDTLRRLLAGCRTGDEEACWQAAAAMELICQRAEEEARLHATVAELAADPPPGLAGETATWAARRLGMAPT